MSGGRHIDRSTQLDVGKPPYSTGWQAFDVKFHNFASLSATSNGDFGTTGADISCFGRLYKFNVGLVPEAEDSENGGKILAALACIDDSESVDDIEYDAEIICLDGSTRKMTNHAGHEFYLSRGMKRLSLYPYQDILNPENDILVDGALVIRVYMKDKGQASAPSPSFIPTNPLCKAMLNLFLDETNADILFEVAGQDSTSCDNFYAHRFILQACAPSLAELCEGTEKVTSVTITDVRPEIFRALLYYVYGGEVSCKLFKDHSREIIEAADKYNCPNLKVEAEVWYVKSTTITMENVLDNFYFADTKKCALLKEKVMDFIVDNGRDVLDTLSAHDLPQSQDMLSDILTAVTKGKGDEKDYDGVDPAKFKTMSIHTLRRKLHARGLKVDGTREMLIAALKESSKNLMEDG